MGAHQSAEEIENEHLRVLGPDLGPVYNSLYQECAWLHIKWREYGELYAAKPERIDLLNRASGLFFRVVQDALWDDTLLHLARLTDPLSSSGKDNLTILRLPPLVDDIGLKNEVQPLVDAAVDATAFARDWRNRRIAHRDLALALQKGPIPLALASRKRVKNALHAIGCVLKRINRFYFDSDLKFDVIAVPSGAVELLHVIRDGLQANDKRRQRLREGKFDPNDVRILPV